MVAAVSRQLAAGFAVAVAAGRRAPTTVALGACCAATMPVGTDASAAISAEAKGAHRATEARTRVMWQHAGDRPAPLMVMVMDVVGFEGDTIAFPTRRSRTDATQR
jgi:hypothetical protein